MRKLFLMMALGISMCVSAQHGKVALIIGNSTYEGHFSPLNTPNNDAKAMDNVLKKLGFYTIRCRDLKRDSMDFYIQEFAEKANGAEMALFYYSGHAGIGKNNEYYLAPSGKYNNSTTLVASCYPFSIIEERISRISAPVKIYIMDACRSSITGNKDRVYNISRSISKNEQYVSGSVLIYATDVNREARTGIGDYSVFTGSLLNHIFDKDDLYTVWEKVTNEVVMADPEQKPRLDEDERTKPSRRIYLNPQGINYYDKIKEGKDLFSITTIPSDAKITIDNKTYKSGDNIELIYDTKHPYIVSAEGYETVKGEIIASPYKTNYPITLIKLDKAKLKIRANKKGAIVFLDNKKIGEIPITIDTYSGRHDIRVEKKNYYEYNSMVTLKGGDNNHYVELKRKYPWTWSSNYNSQLNIISYHYSPKYPIGLSYMYRIEDYGFSFGLIGGVSTGLFRGVSTIEVVSQSQGMTIDISGEKVDVSSSKIINGAGEPYSDFVDPYNEAQHYDASALILANMGYSPINGLMLEVGLGAGYHQDRYYMNDTYYIKTNTITDPVTGKTSESYEYTKTGIDQWYKQNGKWSFATRVGTRFILPLIPSDDIYFSLGGGYTFLLGNNKYNSWDANIGICWGF